MAQLSGTSAGYAHPGRASTRRKDRGDPLRRRSAFWSAAAWRRFVIDVAGLDQAAPGRRTPKVALPLFVEIYNYPNPPTYEKLAFFA